MKLNTDVDVNLLNDEDKFSAVITPKNESLDLVAWASNNKIAIRETLTQTPVLLFRNFDISQDNFPQFCHLFGEPLQYMYRSTPRTETSTGVYTATEYPPNYEIPQHCENAYQTSWPMHLFFYCSIPPAEGGQTPVANIRKVTQQIDPEIKDFFKERKVMYVRNYNPGLDLPWQTVFQTQNRVDVETYCRDNQIHFEWKGDTSLKTWQVCDAMANHPVTGEELWFNQAHLFHISSIDDNTRNALISLYGKENLPRNAYLGDGGDIDPAILDKIRDVYAANKQTFDWQQNDVMLIDNMLSSHGRNPFKGERKILVSMNSPYAKVEGKAE